MFDSRPSGVGNGKEVVMSDTFTPFISTPLLKGMNYSSVGESSATLKNAKPFAALPFSVSVSSPQLRAAIAAVNLRFPGTGLGTDLDR